MVPPSDVLLSHVGKTQIAERSRREETACTIVSLNRANGIFIRTIANHKCMVARHSTREHGTQSLRFLSKTSSHKWGEQVSVDKDPLISPPYDQIVQVVASHKCRQNGCEFAISTPRTCP